LFATAGLHPHHAADLDAAALEEFRTLALAPEVVATGEMGLDFYRDFSPRPVQEEAFRRQLELAIAVGKPVFLHQRDAHERFIAVLRDYLPALPRAVVHCFTGTGDELRECLDQGLYVGITGWICDERRGRHLLDLVGVIPEDRLMIETDAPYLLPRTLRPKPDTRRNEPMYLPAVLDAIAGVTGRSVAAVAGATTRTARTFFGLPPV
jgi:TatD DNase family protein